MVDHITISKNRMMVKLIGLDAAINSDLLGVVETEINFDKYKNSK